MVDPPLIRSLREQAAAIIRLTVPRSDMPKVMGPAIQELRAALNAQGRASSEALFAHHLRMDHPTMFDVELGLPVDDGVIATGRVRPGSLPAGRVAMAVYRGGYEGLPAAWNTFRRWIAENGHARAADLWEVYAAGPESSQDPAEWRTELYQPLRN